VPMPISQPIYARLLKAEDVVKAAEKKFEFQQTLIGDKVVLTEKHPVQVLHVAPPAWSVPEVLEAARLLHLKPGLPAYPLVPADEGQMKGVGPGPRAELRVSTRSVLGASLFMARGIEIPPEHYERGLVAAPVDENGASYNWADVTEGLFQVHVQKKKPKCAYVAVKHCGYWYYIASDDRTSKASFVLMMQLYDLQIAPRGQAAPVLTLPVTGTGGGHGR
jgi:hypothetical protein